MALPPEDLRGCGVDRDFGQLPARADDPELVDPAPLRLPELEPDDFAAELSADPGQDLGKRQGLPTLHGAPRLLVLAVAIRARRFRRRKRAGDADRKEEAEGLTEHARILSHPELSKC